MVYLLACCLLSYAVSPSPFLVYDLIRNAEKVVMPLAMAAVAVLAAGRFKSEPAIIAIPDAIALKGSQFVIARDILSFIIRNLHSKLGGIKIKIFPCFIKMRMLLTLHAHIALLLCACGENLSPLDMRRISSG